MLFQRLACAVAMGAAVVTSAAAADLPVDLPPASWPPVVSPAPIPQWTGEIGGRYWYSDGRTKLNLYGFVSSPGPEISRLTYSNLQAHTGEIFGRIEHLSGFFVKGFAGWGGIPSGNLQDEDFLQVFGLPYSSTDSDQRDGRLGYATADFGWTWRSEGIKVGFFAGYNYYSERVNAFGCTQTAGNPFICVPPIPNSVLAITQDTTWHTARLGVNFEWQFVPGWGISTDRVYAQSGWRVSADLAWTPYAVLDATDTHWLRTDLGGPIAEQGWVFTKFQVEALLSYQFLNGFSLGLGGRYWSFQTLGGSISFPSGDQAIDFTTQRWGGFLQASYKFGELWPTRFVP